MAAGAHGSTGDELPRLGRSVAEVERSADDADDVVVRLSGDHDLATIEMLSAALADAAAGTVGAVIIDLENVTFMDASVVGVLLAERRTGGDAAKMRMRRPSPSARRVLDACDLSHLVEPARPEGTDPGSARSALETWVHVPPDTGAGEPAREIHGSTIPAVVERKVVPRQ